MKRLLSCLVIFGFGVATANAGVLRFGYHKILTPAGHASRKVGHVAKKIVY